MSLKDVQRPFSSRDVYAAAGLTSRQQNDWDERGALPHARSGEKGWRQFSFDELFAITVSSEIRQRFGLPVERLKWIQEVIDESAHLLKAVEIMESLGVAVWLLTDFETIVLVESELHLMDLWRAGTFNSSVEVGFALVNMTPLVNRVLACAKKPVRLELHGIGREALRRIETLSTARSPEEIEILRMIRSREFKRVEIVSSQGQIELIKTTSHPEATAHLEDLLSSHNYQSLKVTMKDGRVVSLVQEVTVKSGSGSRAT